MIMVLKVGLESSLMHMYDSDGLCWGRRCLSLCRSASHFGSPRCSWVGLLGECGPPTSQVYLVTHPYMWSMWSHGVQRSHWPGMRALCSNFRCPAYSSSRGTAWCQRIVGRAPLCWSTRLAIAAGKLVEYEYAHAGALRLHRLGHTGNGSRGCHPAFRKNRKVHTLRV